MDLTLLTKRELEVASLLAQGHRTKEVALRLFLSHKTVETHRCRIRARLNIRSGVDWMNFCRQFPADDSNAQLAV